MQRKLRVRFWIEALLGAFTGFLLVLTLVWRDWIEGVFGVDPDHGNGSLEWLICAVCLVATAVFFLAARRDWRAAALAAG
ncbi:MAG: hypothetical protein WAK71_02840 [Streptosporangiaceae bacterium]